jgi:hypothetical protein
MSSTTLSSQPFFSPLQISGCGLWLDASDPRTLSFANGTNVSTWTDKSANIQAQYLTQAMATARAGTSNSSMTGLTGSPNYPVSGSNINGLNSLYFNQSVLQAITTQNVNTRSYFIVVSVPTSAGGPSILWPGTWASYSGGVYALGGSIGGNSSQMIMASQNVANLLLLNYVQNSAFILSITFNNGTTNMWNTGGGITTPTGQTAATLSITSDNYLWIGGASGVFGAPFLLGEFIEYNSALNTTQRQQVEGYLAWKWGLVGNLPSTHPYKTTSLIGNNVLPPLVRSLATTTTMAPSQSPFVFFTPTQIPGCGLWLDGADSSTRILTGNNLTQWNDKSPNRFNVTPYSTFSNATISSRYQNNNDVINFSGFNLYKTANNSAFYPLDAYILISLKPGVTGTNICSLARSDTIFEWTSFTLGAYSPARWNQSSAFGSRSYDTSFTETTPTSFLIMNWTLANNNYSIRRNTLTIGSTSSYTWSLPANPTFCIGFPYVDNVTVNFNAYIGEIIFFTSVLAITQRQQIEGYLAWKWGLQASLPASHPFRNAPPGLPVPVVPLTRQMSSGVFGPLRIPGCQLWLDAADRTTIVGTNPITLWNDKSGTGKIVTFVNTNTYTSGISVNTNGSSSSFFRVNIDFRKSTAPFVNMFIVHTWAGSGFNTQQALYGQDDGGGFNRIQFLSVPSDVNAAYGFYYGNSPPYTLRAPSLNSGNRLLYNANLAYLISNSTYLSVNGTNTGSITEAAASPQTSTQSLGFASQNTTGGSIGTINFHEIIIYVSQTSNLSTSQIKQIEGYLAWKWGLQGNLPPNHPYKMFPPPP